MTHAHGVRKQGFCWEPGAAWRGARHWLAAAGRGRGGPRGFGGPGRHGFGGPHGFGPPWGRHGGRRPRGDVRAAILVLLDEEPRNGYGIMQEIEERSAGAWRPSPGSVYPVLQQLEDEGLVRAAQTGERKLMELTDEGKTYVEERRETLGTPWEAAAAGMSEEMVELRTLIWQTAAAVREVVATGNAEQHAKARSLLEETRRGLYRILAGDEPGQ
jgi:DNA-binding PadR family transcriptional regulator